MKWRSARRPSFEVPSSSAKLFEEEFFWKCFAKERKLSVYSRDLNESINVVGIFCHKQLDALD